MSDEKYMRRALELAQLGLGRVSTNPMVGCVIVHEDKIIGEGYYQAYGAPHAEVNAINQVKNQEMLQTATAYVTLEPCSIFAKTPPCADLLLEKKVKKVVIASVDPNIKINGAGIKKLKDGGVEVEVGMLQKEADELNKRFIFYHTNKQPYVILKWAQTLDGFVARENNDSKWISNEMSRQLVHKWRTEEDAILVGKNTAIYDDPALTAREWTGKHPVRILLDRKLEVPSTHKLFDNTVKTLVINSKKEGAKERTEWIKTNDFTPRSILSILFDHSIQSVIIEGGSKVLNSFITENCWNEARVFISKQSFGSGIKAPEINKPISMESDIHGDQLRTYRNNG